MTDETITDIIVWICVVAIVVIIVLFILAEEGVWQ